MTNGITWRTCAVLLTVTCVSLAWLGSVSSAAVRSKTFLSDDGYCGANLLRDYEKPLRTMPSISRVGDYGQLPFGPPFIRLGSGSPVVAGSDRVGFSLYWYKSFGEATMDWELTARFVRVTSAGRPLLNDVRHKRLVVRRMGAELPDENARFAVSAQPAFYRVDIAIRDREGGHFVRYAEYFRVVTRKFNVRLGLKRDVLEPGGTVVLRLESFGTVGAEYGYQYWIERRENETWVVDDATPDNFFAPSFYTGMGRSSGCEKLPLPDDMQPGLYRITKEVGPSYGPGRERLISKAFWVVPG